MSTRNWIITVGGLLVVGGIIAAVVVPRVSGNTVTQTATDIETAQVTTLTAISSVESSGSVEPQQQESLSWKTTGTVTTVNIKIGDRVQAGDILMAIDPATAPQSVILAQADLIAARNNLNNLLNPDPVDIANAQKTVTDAEQTLVDAQQDLKYAENPAGKGLYDAVSDAKLALETAQANLTLTSNNSDVQAYYSAVASANQAFSRYQDAKAKYDESNNKTELYDLMQRMEAAYQSALAEQQRLETKINSEVANKDDSVKKAQADYDEAVANLNGALQGPDPLDLRKAQDAVAVAEAKLADARQTLNELTIGADPDDVAAAQAKVLASEATLDSLTLKAPFAGEVIDVNYQPGDSASQSDVAVVLANRSRLHVEVSVDETDISQIALGNPVTLSFDSLPEMTFAGLVAQIVPKGETVGGLVKYTVRVDLETANPKILNGMTANVVIVTATTEGALAIPLNAVQLDGSTEYVNRMKADGTYEKVEIVSGQVQAGLVVVSGDLKPGETVLVGAPQPESTFRPPFAGGG